jgi:hypothetical protein
MSRHEFSLLTGPKKERQIEIGGGARVARIFLPAVDSSSAIRLAGRGHRRATARNQATRRELARTIEPRRRAS